MRLFLLPLSTRRAFIYCDKQVRSTSPELLTAGTTPSTSTLKRTPPSHPVHNDSDKANKVPATSTQESYIDKATNKVATTWAEWERADIGWKKQLTVYGNVALRRIAYEEWGLKSFPPLTDARRETALKDYATKRVEVLFPPTFMKQANVDSTLLELAQERQSLHSKRMWYCIIGAPLTLPFALIPILPNIPGLYLVFRAWSHYKALYGARYLEFLVSNQLYRPVAAQELDRIYDATVPTSSAARKSRTATAAAALEKDTVLLTAEGGQQIAKAFEVSELGVELERAVEQVEKAVAGSEQAVKDPALSSSDKEAKQ